MQKYTKIVATISDKRCDVDFIRSLYENGLNVVRMNSAHLTREGFERIVGNVRAVSPAIGILMDTKGAEIRTTTNSGDEKLTFNAGDTLEVAGDPDGVTTASRICLNYAPVADYVKPGDHLLIDDGELDFLIDSVEGGVMHVTARNSGELGSRKSVNIPGTQIPLPSLTERDRTNINIAIELGIDFIAHSFVRSARDVNDIREILDAHGSHIEIISKIENQEGIDNFDEILDASYGIMIARGDLGIEVPAERLPVIQQQLINKCIMRHKPVIVATQMLHSMITNPRPTRAEVSDIANAVNQRADAIMLSGETAYGRYPVEAISTMSRVAAEMERSLEHTRIMHTVEPEVISFLARQAVASGQILDTRAIITDSYTGRTARYVSSYRGSLPTMAVCYNDYVQRRLALSYGVFPLAHITDGDQQTRLNAALLHIVDHGIVGRTDRVAYLGGKDGTSFLELNTAGALIDNFARYCRM